MQILERTPRSANIEATAAEGPARLTRQCELRDIKLGNANIKTVTDLLSAAQDSWARSRTDCTYKEPGSKSKVYYMDLTVQEV